MNFLSIECLLLKIRFFIEISSLYICDINPLSEILNILTTNTNNNCGERYINIIMVIFSQYTYISSHHIVHLKFIEFYLRIITNKAWKSHKCLFHNFAMCNLVEISCRALIMQFSRSICSKWTIYSVP
jgi:hypothetical protein